MAGRGQEKSPLPTWPGLPSSSSPHILLSLRRQLAAGGRQGSGGGTLAATPRSRSARRAVPRPSPRHKGGAASRDPAPGSLPTPGAAHLPHRGGGSRAPPAAPLRPPLPQENAAAGLASCSASCASVPPPPPAAGVSGRRGSRAGRAGRGQRQHHHVAARRRPPPTWIPREREGRCSPLPSPSTPRGPKFRESGDPAPRPACDLREVLATAPARPPPLSPQASGVRGWLLVPSDRGPFPADGFHHHHLKLVGNTRALTPGFRTGEIPNSVHFWSTCKVVCGRGGVLKVTEPSAFLTTVKTVIFSRIIEQKVNQNPLVLWTD